VLGFCVSERFELAQERAGTQKHKPKEFRQALLI